MIIKTDQEALEALEALTGYLKGGNRETIKKPLTTQEICQEISADFKRRRITHQIAADKIGTTKQTISNQISGKKNHYGQKNLVSGLRRRGISLAF